MTSYTLKFGDSISVTRYHIQNILDRVSMFQDVRNSTITLDFKSSKFIASELTPIIDSIINYLESNGNKVLIDVQSITYRVKQTLTRNLFLKEHDLPYSDTVHRYHTSIPYTQFTLNAVSNDWSNIISHYLRKKVFESDYWPKENDKIAMSKIKESIVEIVDNIFTHSNSEKIFLCGQYYPNKNRLNFVISDIGDGIPKTVSKMPENKHKSDAEKIDWAMSEGTTTINEMSQQTTRGIGLSTIYAELLSYGELTIISETGYWKLTSGTDTIKPTTILDNFNFGLKGTLIHLSFFIDKMTKDSDLSTTSSTSADDNCVEDIF